METAADRLKWARRQAGYGSAASFARAAGVPEVTYRAHEKGLEGSGGRGLSERAARDYAHHLGIDWVWLMTGAGQPATGGPTDPATFPAPALLAEREIKSAPPELPGAASFPRDVPVRGIAVGGDDGHFEFNGEVVDYARRPPGIAGARNVFAIYVRGSSMAPRFEEGELVFVHPDRPPVPGCDVLVELHGEAGQPGLCFIKRLVRRTASRLVLAQFNPPREDLAFESGRVRNLFRILTPGDLFGV